MSTSPLKELSKEPCGFGKFVLDPVAYRLLKDGQPVSTTAQLFDLLVFLVDSIGRMQGDFRFSFILPLRAEMFRKLASYEPPTMPSVVATEPQ
jgi:hypothetical protein